MPFSQIIPPSLSPTESIRLFYTSVSLLLSRTQGYRFIFSRESLTGQLEDVLNVLHHTGTPDSQSREQPVWHLWAQARHLLIASV